MPGNSSGLSSNGLLRLHLKLRISDMRGALTSKGYRPICAYCGHPIYEKGYDMHEVLITRGDVHGQPDLWEQIMVIYNCVNVHHGDCHLGAATEEGQRTCIIHLLYFIDFELIKRWLLLMKTRMRSSTPTKALHLVETIKEELDAVHDL